MEVYQDWCGPCKAVVSTLKKQFFELGERPLKIYMASTYKQHSCQSICIALQCTSCCLQANCKHIAALEKFSGHCEPVFVFYQVEHRHFLLPKSVLCDLLNSASHTLQDGKLLNTVSGVNAPVLCTSIDKLSAEAAAAVAAKA